MSAEALARVLWATEAMPGTDMHSVQAERILADPGPLLAALAEAGILTEEWAVQMLLNDGSGGKVITGWDNRRYTREQATADALSHGTPDVDGNPRHWCRLVRRHVSEWVQP